MKTTRFYLYLQLENQVRSMQLGAQFSYYTKMLIHKVLSIFTTKKSDQDQDGGTIIVLYKNY